MYLKSFFACFLFNYNVASPLILLLLCEQISLFFIVVFFQNIFAAISTLFLCYTTFYNIRNQWRFSNIFITTKLWFLFTNAKISTLNIGNFVFPCSNEKSDFHSLIFFILIITKLYCKFNYAAYLLEIIEIVIEIILTIIYSC